MILADTSVWIDFYRGTINAGTSRLRTLIGSGELMMGDLIACEILQGVPDEAEAVRVTERLATLPLASMVGRDVALTAATHYRVLRGRGITIRKTIDLIIGTFCIVNGHRLLHNDRDFVPMVQHLGLREA